MTRNYLSLHTQSHKRPKPTSCFPTSPELWKSAGAVSRTRTKCSYFSTQRFSHNNTHHSHIALLHQFIHPMSSEGNHIATSDMDPAVKQGAALVDDVESLDTTHESSPSPNPEVPQPHRSKTAPPPGMGQDLPDDEDQTTDEAGYTSTPSEPSSCDSSPRSSTHGGILSESPAPVLRRSSSSVEAGSNGIRVQKHLRFTAMDAGSLTMSSEEKHVVFPGEGSRRRKRGVPKDQKWLLSEPATPNLSET